MSRLGKRAREALADESGFTLPEVLVTSVLLVVVLFSLYGIFDASVRVFALGNDRTEATETARLGLSRMEREIRAAVQPTGATQLLLDRQQSSIRFRHSPNCNPADPACTPETVTYRLNGSALERNTQPVVENVSAVEFKYCSTPSECTPEKVVNEAETRIVRISLTVTKNGRAQNLSTDVYLRNRE
ncbi:prepilin-type N-terminal cleavage/methylation domain [Rubrobacter radiotolerans]|uniref:Prepilin-type N-terminal cleavage/methylation domain n=1 Tax=Rubrobacter radiotolerans TaxID=42256 RepID=A0A023X2C0_RUBRA|nr:prepilin-type N-terminal cleavage/methylation domain-containing protein [Rubrobacter radiotolerans]AHY46140.1 prepilin-type N-terminal cleavage/methylation domain [Rubrobacter radiotolerans]MDX5893550.1 prepilin-type N-terminal cleavage/methylation domain-containing protein [Rubrobacter radiotolerans]SMC03965.1 prepilin-type N-terminal cleavage/methylation domain-containing protein [Rubrobacter radiotolerans DSM 5868]